MSTAAAVVIAGGLATGCDDKEWRGRITIERDPAATRAATATPTGTPTKQQERTASPRPSEQAGEHQRRKSTHAPATPHRTAAPTPRPSPAGIGTAAERKVVRLVNAARAKAGCTALRADKRLRKAAYLHSRDMGENHYFEHDSQDGRTPWDRIRAQGYDHPAAENIAAGQRTPASVMAAWMHSKGHRANIVNCDYKAIGVGRWKGGGAPVWTQDFGRE